MREGKLVGGRHAVMTREMHSPHNNPTDSLTASPNNQLRAEDVNQQRREKSQGAPRKTSGSDSAAVNS